MTWKELTDKQKKEYRQYCDQKYGSTIVLSESGEPLYFDEQMRMHNTNIILDLLFLKNHN